MKPTKPPSPTVEVIHQAYQPSKAELEADLRLKGTFKQAIQAVLRPVRIRRVTATPRTRANVEKS